MTIDSCIYQIHKTKMRRVAVTSIPLQTQVCCNAFSPDHEKLMLGCIDGSVVLFDEGRGITHLVKAAFVSCSFRSGWSKIGVTIDGGLNKAYARWYAGG